jgi:kynurenine formamidase/glyoxylase-like metal-dependent hydrolase (beta-lactamase superfamily II)
MKDQYMKNMLLSLVVLQLFIVLTPAYPQKSKSLPFKITVFTGPDLFENAFLIQSGKNFVLIDALASETAASEISKAIEGKKLTTIFITHGHPDHFLGLSTILKDHPDAQIYTGAAGVKKDIIKYVNDASSKGLMERQPGMKMKSDTNPDGFDYDKIKVLADTKLTVGEGHSLIIENIVEGTESGHHSILYSHQLSLLFAGDLLYNNVFNWLGSGVEPSHINNWIKRLHDLKAKFNNEDVVIYPGHGKMSNRKLFDTNIQYLGTFREILGRTKSKADAVQFYKQLYPDYRGEFLLSRSIDHWMDSAINKSKYISINHIQDLTHTLASDFPFIPVPGITFPFKLEPIATLEAMGVRANKWIIHEHIGTQIDAPSHFARDGISLEAFQVEDLVVPVVVVDISKKSLNNPDAELTVEDIRQWEATHGKIPDNACVMMYSGWEAFLYETKYLGLDLQHTKHFPGISLAACQFLVAERNISGVGVDVISLDPGHDNEYKGHKVILDAGKWIVEAAANLKMIPPRGAYLFVGSPKVKGATGGIVRLLAVW